MDWRFWTRKQNSQGDTCADLEPLLSLYSDGMASPEEARRVESHLSTCEDCQRARRWMEVTHLVISKRPAVEPPANLRLRIAQAIAEAEQAEARSRPAVRPLILRPASLALAVAASFALVGVLITEHSLPPSPVTSPVGTNPPLPPSPVSPPTVTPLVKSPQKVLRVATAQGADAGHIGKPPSAKIRRAAPEPTLVAKVTVDKSEGVPAGTTPVVQPIPAVTPRKSMSSGLRLAVLKTTPSVHPRVKPSIDKTQHEAARPTTNALPKQSDTVPAANTMEATNTAPSEDVVTPTLPPSVVEIGPSAVIHQPRVDALTSVRAHLISFQDEHHDIKVALSAGARAATSAGTQFVMLPTVYSPTFLSKSPASENH